MRDRVLALAVVAACSHADSDPLAPIANGRPGSGGDHACGSSIDPSGEHRVAPAFVVPNGRFTPRAQHPRLLLTPERLARARSWIAATRFAPRDDDLAGNALVCAATGDAEARSRVLAQLRTLVAEHRLESADGARWFGEAAILAYDWCHDAIPEAERVAFVQYANAVFARGQRESWGGVGQEDSNYYWGYLRNSLEWAIASGPENPRARDFADDALVTRFERSFLPFAERVQKNGVSSEGTQYGRYQQRYPMIPFVTLHDGGRRIFDETDFYRGLVYYNIHNALPAPTIRDGRTVADPFPHEDDEDWLAGHSGDDSAYGDTMTALAWLWSDRPVGRHARWWLRARKVERSPIFEATDPGGDAGELTAIPLDYYAPGVGYLWARNAWSASASVVFAQFGTADGKGHQHLDAGTFQLWRNGRWLSRETVAYTEDIAGYRGAGREPARTTIGHNAILFGGLGAARAYPDAPPRVLRVESRKDYTYIASDLSGYYRARSSSHRQRDDNPYAGSLVRELIYLRGLETVVVLDRMFGASPGMTKTFLLHVEQTARVRVAGARVLATNGDQTLHVATLVPATPAIRIVDERLAPSDKIGQQRLEIDTIGSYFVTVLQMRDAAARDVAARVTEDADTFTIALEHPTAGRATLTFEKGPASHGGTIATPGCAAHPLATYVQQMTVADDGPTWGP